MASLSISAVFLQGLPQENELNILLSPPNEIRGDIRDLAGSLEFLPDEIFCKEYPFPYLLDSWIRRDGAEYSTLQVLLTNLTIIERPDAAEVVQKVIDELGEQDPKILNIIAKRHNKKLVRSNSTCSLCPTFKQNSQNIDYQTKVLTMSFDQDDTGEEPSAYVVCLSSGKEYFPIIEGLVQSLRGLGINAKADIFETEYSENRGYYIYSNLIDTEHVLVLCLPSEQLKNKELEVSKKDDFVMKLITDFLYDSGPYKSKYIPVLVPGATKKDVPFVLNGFPTYNMSDIDFYEQVERALFKVEQYELSPVRKDYKFKSKTIF